MAGQSGAKDLQKICAAICLEEKRHEDTYQFFIECLLKVDPEGVIFAFEKMMRQQIAMPAQLMTDGIDLQLFESFSSVTQAIGVYSAKDYSRIVAFLVKKWDLANLSNLSAEAEKARDYLCKLSIRYDKLAKRMKKPQPKTIPFSWIYGRSIKI
jgi:acyl-[acyl-carrier-protein] desaturase